MRAGFDLETTALTPWKRDHEILSVAVAPPLPSTIVETWYRQEPGVSVAPPDMVADAAELAMHNGLAFDAPWWRAKVGPLEPRWFDTQVAGALLDEERPNSLDDLAYEYLGESKLEIDVKNLAELPPEQVLEYNAKDADLTRQLADALEPELDRQDLRRVFDFYMAAGRPLVEMSVAGIAFDQDRAAQLLEVIPRRLEQLDERLQSAVSGLVEGPVNWNSPKQLSELLFDEMELPENFLDDPMVGPRSTNKYVLEALRLAADDVEVQRFLSDVAEYRRQSKLVGTYLKPYSTTHLGDDGRIHTFYHVLRAMVGKTWAGAKGGRLSSSKPNLQNIANDADLLSCFVAPPGKLLGVWDYRQLELVLMAWYAQERELLDAFAAGRDMHSAVLARMSGTPYADVVRLVDSDPRWKEKRRYTKNVHFTILYQGTKYAIRRQARMAGNDLSYPQAQKMLDDWYARYPRVRMRIDAWTDEARRTGEVIAPTGMRRRVPDAPEGGKKGKRAERQAVSALVQGFAGQIMLAGILALEERLADFPGARMIQTVHDSVAVEYPEEYAEALPPVVADALTNGARSVILGQFGVGKDLPLDVDAIVGLKRLAEPTDDYQ